MTHPHRSFVLSCLSCSALIALVACSDTTDDPVGHGSGGSGVGGSLSTGGMSVSGGSPGVGGTPSSGGVPPGVGGTTTGGAAGVGGTTDATGGVTGVGGNTGGAGNEGSGGTDAAGGETGTGGDQGTGGSDANEPEFHIYLAVGQSNMQGAAHVPADPPFHERVQIMQSENCPQDGNETPYGEWREMFVPIVTCKEGSKPILGGGEAPIGLGPSDSFAVAMAEASGENVTIGIVGAAHGDTFIRQHLPGCTSDCLPSWGTNINGAPVVNGTTPLFDWVVDLAKKAQERGVIKGIIFHQGENDAGSQTWPSQVNAYVTALRTELGLNAEDVPFIAGELPYTGCCASHNTLVQQIPSVVENGHYVSAGPMEDGTVLGLRSNENNETHWSSDAVIEMGKRYAAKMLEAQGRD